MLLVIDSAMRHDHATGRHGDRRCECHEAGALLGVGALGDLVGARHHESTLFAVRPSDGARRAALA